MFCKGKNNCFRHFCVRKHYNYSVKYVKFWVIFLTCRERKSTLYPHCTRNCRCAKAKVAISFRRKKYSEQWCNIYAWSAVFGYLWKFSSVLQCERGKKKLTLLDNWKWEILTTNNIFFPLKQNISDYFAHAERLVRQR